MEISEMVGHLRKMHREYKAYEKALEIADILESSQKMIKEMEADRERLEAEKVELDKDNDNLVEQVNSAVAKLNGTNEEIERKLDVAKKDAEAIISKAKTEAENILIEANNRVKVIGEEIKQLSSQRNSLIDERNAESKRLASVKEEIVQVKKKFSESL